MLQYALPMATGRGAGLGNELIPWGKAYIASRVLGIPALHPAWGLNTRRYWEYFGTSRIDWPPTVTARLSGRSRAPLQSGQGCSLMNDT